MNKKLALIAASVIAISAYTNAHAVAQEAEAQPVAEDQGALDTLFEDEQPPLEGDGPLADEDTDLAAEGDDALIGEPYAQDDALDGADDAVAAPDFAQDVETDTDPLATQETDVLTAQETPETDAEATDPAFADTDPAMSDDPMMDTQDEAPELATDTDADGYLNDADRTAMTPGEAIDAAPMADSGPAQMDGTETDADAMPMTADAEPMDDTELAEDAVVTADAEAAEASEPLPAPDAKIAAVPTDPTEAVAEAALIAGTYEVTIPNRAGTSTLFIEGRGTEAAGTFDGEPIDVIVTGRNFSFDAPVTMDGEEQLMTFAGTAEDGVIDNGVIEAQGDGGYLTFDARRVDAASMDDAATESDTDMDAMDSGDMGDMDTEEMGSDAFGSDDADVDAGVTTDMNEGDADFGTTDTDAMDADVMDEAGDDAGFEGTFEDDATDMDASDTDASLDADVPSDFETGAEDREAAAARAAGFADEADADVMDSEAMETDSAADALTTDGGLEGDADDFGTDDMGDTDAMGDMDASGDMGAEDLGTDDMTSDDLGTDDSTLATDDADSDVMEMETDTDADSAETDVDGTDVDAASDDAVDEDLDETQDPNFDF